MPGKSTSKQITSLLCYNQREQKFEFCNFHPNFRCPLSCKFPIEPDNLQRVYGVGPSSLPSSRRASETDFSVFSNPNGIPDVEHTFKVKKRRLIMLTYFIILFYAFSEELLFV